MTKIYTKLKAYPYEFEINDKLQLAKIDGVEVADSGNTSSGLTREEVQIMIATALESYAQKSDLNDYAKLTDIPTQQQVDLSNYATKTDVANAVKPYTNLTWELIDSTKSTTWTKSSKSIEGYNYIAICCYGNNTTMCLGNPTIISTDEFKKHNAESKNIWSFWSTLDGGMAYYNNGLWFCFVNGEQRTDDGGAVYGIK